MAAPILPPLPAEAAPRPRCAGSGTARYFAAADGWATCRVCVWPVPLDDDRRLRFHEAAVDLSPTD